MHSIKTFWSPELKKERALRKEESAKYSLINDQLKLLNQENQKQAMLVRQLEEELRLRLRQPAPELQGQLEALFAENEHLQREIAILRDTIKELELRIETQKQTLQARDESIKKLLEMLQNKGMGKEEERQMFQQMQAMAQKQLDEFRLEIQRRDQEILAMAAKMKALEEQHQDYQRHIAVLKESLCAKEEHYSMLQTDVEELKARLDEKSRMVDKKTAAAMGAAHELAELRDHSEIKDRKINVLQRKLDLRETNKKLQAAGAQNAKAGEDSVQARKQIQEEFKKLEDARKQFDEQRRTVEIKRKDVEEREKALAELDRQLKKRKEQMDQMEASLRKAGGSTAAVGELNRKLTESQKEADQLKQQMEQSKEEAKRLTTETERLLQLVQMSQEEQAQKEKQIMDLTQSMRSLQAKMKSQQQAQAQKEEEISRARLNELAAIDDLSKTLAEKDDLKVRLEDKKMKVIDLEIELNESSLILSELLKISESRELTSIKRSQSYFELQKSGKVANRLDKCRYSRSDNEIDVMLCEKEPPSICRLTRKISQLTKEMSIKNSKIMEQQRCISILEEALRENNNIAEFEQLLAVVRSKDERINELEQNMSKKSGLTLDCKDKRILELEEALKESFMVAAEREKVFYEEEQRRIETLHKMKKLEQRIRSLQNASAMNCPTCSAALKRLKMLERTLRTAERKRDEGLRQLSHVIQDILEEAISEKDSLIAELEMKGVLDESETMRCEALKIEKDKLLNRLKNENTLIVELQKEESEDPGLESSTPDLTLADELLAVCDDNVIIWEDDIPATML